MPPRLRVWLNNYKAAWERLTMAVASSAWNRAETTAQLLMP